jgi:hypothetical protein
MKKNITIFAILLFFCTTMFAQRISTTHNGGRPVQVDMKKIRSTISAPKANKVSANDTFEVAHFIAAEDTSGAFIYDVNFDYLGDQQDIAFITMFDTLHDSQGNGKSYNSTQSTIVDTIYVACGHKKTSPSSTPNTIDISIFDMDDMSNSDTIAGVIYGAYVWDTTITVNSFAGPTNDWLDVFVLAVPAKFTLPPDHAFGIEVSFDGPEAQDTFGVVVGYYEEGACASSNPNPYSASESLIPYNTFRQFATIDTSFTPTPSFVDDFWYPSGIWGGVFYRDCNNNGSYDTGSNEESLFQSAYIWCKVIQADPTGPISVSEGVLASALNIFPNPSNGSFTVNMDLGTSVDMNISVTDLQGKEVYTESISNASNFSRNLDLTHLNKGVYIFRAATATGSAIQKIVIK